MTTGQAERTCPRCDEVNHGRDFCGSCGEYLRWDRTMFLPAIEPGRATKIGRPPAEMRAALVPHVSLAARPSAQAAIALSAPGSVWCSDW